LEQNDTKELLFNSITLIGRAGSDTEIKYFDDGKAKAHVSIAVNRIRAKGSEDITDWFRVEFWGRDAEIAAEYVKKGTLIAIDGRLNHNRWIDRTSGQQRQMYSVSCNSFRLLGSRRENQEYASNM